MNYGRISTAGRPLNLFKSPAWGLQCCRNIRRFKITISVSLIKKLVLYILVGYANHTVRQGIKDIYVSIYYSMNVCITQRMLKLNKKGLRGDWGH